MLTKIFYGFDFGLKEKCVGGYDFAKKENVSIKCVLNQPTQTRQNQYYQKLNSRLHYRQALINEEDFYLAGSEGQKMPISRNKLQICF